LICKARWDAKLHPPLRVAKVHDLGKDGVELLEPHPVLAALLHKGDERVHKAHQHRLQHMQRREAWQDNVNVNVNELRLGFSNTTRHPEGILSHNNRKS
jgi:hypothetical protein